MSDILCSFLSFSGYTCSAVFTGVDALKIAGLIGHEPNDQFPFDIILCDLMLPGITGEQIIHRIRGAGIQIPVIVISAKTLLYDRVAVLRLGADDYLVKPFELEELLARIEVQLRKTRKSSDSQPGGEITFGRWVAKPDSRILTVEGQRIELTRSEFDILLTLMNNPNRAFSRSELLNEAFEDGGYHDDGTARTHISNIRTKLKGTGTEDYIETVWGFGFRLTDNPL